MNTLATFFDWFFFILAVNEDNRKISDGFKIRQDWTRDLFELAALERLENSP